MRYHLFQKFFGKMVKIKETSLLSQLCWFSINNHCKSFRLMVFLIFSFMFSNCRALFSSHLLPEKLHTKLSKFALDCQNFAGQTVWFSKLLNSFAFWYSAQCFYREGHAYIVKNPMVCLMGPTTKFLWFWDG